MKRHLFTVLLLGVALCGLLAAQTPTDTFIIETSGKLPKNLAQMVTAAGGTLLRTHAEINMAVARSDNPDFGASMESYSGIKGCTRDFEVQWVPRPDSFDFAADRGPGIAGHLGPPMAAFFYPCQWNMRQIDAPGAWAQGEFGAGVKVAVLDTGVTPSHIDLAGRVDIANSVSMLPTPSICDAFVPDQTTFFDFNFHGSFVSGLIAANGIGITGVAPDATIVGVKVLRCTGSGPFSAVIGGLLYAAQVPGVEVINMSLGAYFPKNLPGGGQLVAAVTKAVNFANSRGVLVVSAAGNNGSDLDHDGNFISLPAQAGAGIAAWAGDIDGNLASYSNHGVSGAQVGAGGGDNTPSSPMLPLPGCVIPLSAQDGVMSVCSPTSLFFSCGSGGSYLINGSGTSFSSPMVAGVAALVDGKHGGSKNPGQLKTILKNTADDLGKKGTDNLYGHGRVNADKAVQN